MAAFLKEKLNLFAWLIKMCISALIYSALIAPKINNKEYF